MSAYDVSSRHDGSPYDVDEPVDPVLDELRRELAIAEARVRELRQELRRRTAVDGVSG